MKRIIVIVFVGLTLMAVVCSEGGTVNESVKDVSLMQLIVDPDSYHGELVRVLEAIRADILRWCVNAAKHGDRDGRAGTTTMEELERSFALGEITRDEYERQRAKRGDNKACG